MNSVKRNEHWKCSIEWFLILVLIVGLNTLFLPGVEGVCDNSYIAHQSADVPNFIKSLSQIINSTIYRMVDQYRYNGNLTGPPGE